MKDARPNNVEVIELLTRHGISPTQQRIKIAQVLFARPRHFAADQVLDEVNRERTSVSKATVYNTLGLFAERGLVREVIVNPTKIFYDSTTHPHYHYYHVETGELADVAMSDIPVDFIPKPPEGTEIESIDVVVRVRRRSD